MLIEQLAYNLKPVAGSALFSHYLNTLQAVLGRLDCALTVKGGVTNSDIVRSYRVLLVQGKSDFDAIENFSGDAFYMQALGIDRLPCGWLPLDVDTFAMDNGGASNAGVGHTYAGVDGYCPLATNLGRRGLCLALALCPGVQHSASEIDF